MRQKNYIDGFNLSVHEEMFDLPLKWKKPQRIFVNSMSDLFHEELPLKDIQKIFEIMKASYWHTFQVLTKRSHILLEYAKYLEWADNIWMGVTVENQKHVKRIDDLRKTGAKIKFISFEPLLSGINNLNLESIDWVIAGGESGPGARPVDKIWIVEIRDKCIEQNVPFFFWTSPSFVNESVRPRDPENCQEALYIFGKMRETCEAHPASLFFITGAPSPARSRSFPFSRSIVNSG